MRTRKYKRKSRKFKSRKERYEKIVKVRRQINKKGGGILDERFTFPGVNTTRNLMNSGQNIYNTFSGKHLNVSPNPLNQPIYSGST